MKTGAMNQIQHLDGTWQIEQCTENGKKKETQVPGSVQEAFPYYDGIALYTLCFPDELRHFENGSVLLKLEKVDFYCEVTLNGVRLGSHAGGEEELTYDVTGVLRESNTLQVRVITPNETETEGFLLNQTPHRNKVNLGVQPGQSIDTGGILGHVELRSFPRAYVDDVIVRADPDSGKVDVTVHGCGLHDRKKVGFLVYENGSNSSAFCSAVELDFDDRREGHFSFRLEEYKLWSFDEPNLYTMTVTLGESAFRRRFGFRRLEVKNGYFHLNGKRIFLKCSHTGNVFPGGLITTSDMDLLRRDFLYAKACGFNTIRFMAAMAREEQLDLCDELGLMVYDETMAGWNLEDGPHMTEWYRQSVAAMLRRDRNHPCVNICGFLNETKYSVVYETARDTLPMARELAPDMLFLLSSGRWDGEITTGSVSNPGSPCWEAQWGLEGEGERRAPRFDAPYASYVPGMGDQHMYPPFPQSLEMDDFMLRLGEGEKPVFLSEYGHGSQNDVVQEYKKFLEKGMDTTAEDAAVYKSMKDKLERAFRNYRMDRAYGFLEDFLLDTMDEHNTLRLRNLDCVRSNPQLCGYNITGLLDHALTGEGLWTYWRELKPGIADTLRDGWAPLRWGVLLDSSLWYPGKEERIRIFLANEGVLGAGDYHCEVRVRSPKGTAFAKKFTLTVDENRPLAQKAEELRLSFTESGEYEISLQMDEAAPLGGRRRFRVGEPVSGEGKTLYTVGVTEAQKKAMETLGFAVRDALPESPALILVGAMDGMDEPERRERICAITEAVMRGCSAIYTDGIVFKQGDCNEAFMPLTEKGCCYSFYNWLYHLDGVCSRSGALTGIADGILESAALGPVYPERVFEDIQATDDCDCAMFGCGLPRDGGTYTGIALGSYPIGSGRMVLNAFRILDNLGKVYAADRLLVNLVNKYAVSGEWKSFPDDKEEILARIR